MSDEAATTAGRRDGATPGATFVDLDRAWGTVLLTIAVSTVLFGLLATPTFDRLDRRRARRQAARRSQTSGSPAPARRTSSAIRRARVSARLAP
jgi:hypothetical protein